MFILFGTKTTECRLTQGKEYGCPRCGNITRWPLIRYTSWFSLFFIPVFPYRRRYVERCPICHAGRPVSERQAQAMIGANAPSGNTRLLRGPVR